MAVFVYIGEEQETSAFGLRFPRGVPVEVTEPLAMRKLSNNWHFKDATESGAALQALAEIDAGIGPFVDVPAQGEAEPVFEPTSARFGESQPFPKFRKKPSPKPKPKAE